MSADNATVAQGWTDPGMKQSDSGKSVGHQRRQAITSRHSDDAYEKEDSRSGN